MSKSPTVGTEECPIEQVKEVFCSFRVFESVFIKRSDIARHLDLPLDQIERLEKQVVNNESEMKHLIQQLLDIWFEQKASEDQLQDLVVALIKSGLTDLADLLLELFHLPRFRFRTSYTAGGPINPEGIVSESMSERDITDLPPACSKISHRDATWVPHAFTKDLIVGTEGYSIHDVFNQMQYSDPSLFNKKWPQVAVDLDLPLIEIKILKLLVRMNKLRPDKGEIQLEILRCWVKTKGSSASLYELLSALGNIGMKDLAEELESYFCGQHIHQHIIEIKIISEFEKNSSARVKNISKVIYFPDKVLGTGFMGSVVFKGRFDPSSVRMPVAVKRINKSSEKFIKNEINLLKISETINYGNIIQLIGSETQNSFYYLVLELCIANLKDWVEKTAKGMDVQEITDIEILSQCVTGLMYIHEKKVVHRNLKPSKIMLKLIGVEVYVKLSGFGLGTCVSEDTYFSSGPVGSPGWMDPEVSKSKKGDKINGAKADIFSLGCLFYYAFTRGGHPFGNKDGAFRRQVNIEAGNVQMEPCTQYDAYGMTQLIKLMIALGPQNRPPLSIVANHPVFWKYWKIVHFFRQITENEMPTVQQQLEELAIKNEVLGGVGWTEKANAGFNNLSTEVYSERISDLIKAIIDHREKYEICGPKEESYIRKWLDLFPKLLPCTWVAYLSCKNEYKFEEFYENINDPFFEKNLISELI